ncbi:MAG TPA: alpha/beta hydrolase, partial [Chitinophagaceae bacterium]|nr:alpha/beta hydrolase [Chitinophagaceae bacterium]
MKNILSILLILFCAINAHAQNPFTGDWEGKIGAIRLILHVHEADGKLTATLDSPDQGAKGIKCDEVSINKDTITIAVKAANAGYSGILNADKNTVTGTWKQGGQSIALDLKKGNGFNSEPAKPQTPKPPFPYLSEDVEYNNSDQSVHFGATLTIPKGSGPFPAVIIISGSGAQDRDGTMFGHKPYAVLADHLTRNGIAVLRVDDRGTGKTTLGSNFKKLTSVDFAKDVEAGISFLQSRKEIEAAKIGLAGHSEGGMIAPMVAAKNKSVS